jgi:HAD superfamily hydrolase (TIGR01662 family)
MGIIFDLDQTLVDSSLAEPYRGKNWQLAYNEIPNFTYYIGISEIFEYLKVNKIKSCIVTNSISNYCTKVTQHWEIQCDFQICYHDTKLRKPHPEPINRAIEKLDCDLEKILSVGDRDIDIIASHAAGVKSVACLWGSNDQQTLLNANPTFVAATPAELLLIIQEHHNSH